MNENEKGFFRNRKVTKTSRLWTTPILLGRGRLHKRNKKACTQGRGEKGDKNRKKREKTENLKEEYWNSEGNSGYKRKKLLRMAYGGVLGEKKGIGILIYEKKKIPVVEGGSREKDYQSR